jgi:hypothetical protein
LLVTTNIVPSSPILVTLRMEALDSSETSVLTRDTLRNIPEDDIHHSHRRETHKSYLRLLEVSDYGVWHSESLGSWVLPNAEF